MNTEKSIKLLKVIKEILPEHYNFDFGKEEIDEVIKQLQRGNNFEQIYHKVKDIIYSHNLIWLQKQMYELEVKYFSEEKPKIRKIIEVEVLASNREVINELEKEIDEMNGRRFDKGKIRVVSTRWVRN